MKKTLLVAYHFPPVGGLGAAGSQRALKFARHLPERQWQAVVLTVREDSYEQYLAIDPGLLDQVPKSIKVVRTGVLHVLGPILRLKDRIRRMRPGASEHSDPESDTAPTPDTNDRVQASRFQRFKDAITDLFEIPDEVSGWFLPAVVQGFRTIRREKIDLIFATGRPWTTLVIGAVLKILTRKPLVVDFRDPWMTNPFRLEYSPLKNRLEAILEKFVVKSADVIIANTEFLRQEFEQRFGVSVGSKCVTVINGFDADEFSTIKPASRPVGFDDACIMTHSGFLYGRRDPLTLLEAIKKLRDDAVLEEGRFLCNLVGQFELPYDLPEYIEANGLSGFVRLGGHVSYKESLSQLAACDVALLLQPGTATQVPSKLFEYVGLGRRILTIAPRNSAVADIIRDHNLGGIAEPDDIDQIADMIRHALIEWEEGRDRMAIDKDIQAQFDVRGCVKKLAAEFDRVV